MTEKNKAIKILNKLEQSERDDGEIIHLTANESVMSPLANRWQSSILNTRYALGSAEGRNGKKFNLFKKNFISKNINGFDELKTLAENACQKLFYCESSEFRTLSGLHGMISIIGSLTSPGDLIVTLPSQYVGHFTTVSLLKRMGRKNILLPYSSDKFELDLDGLKKIAKNNKIKMVYLDTMHYFYPYPLLKIKEILPDSILVYDGSHILGLIAGGQFQNPIAEGADILLGNAHKTFCGPQKGLIMYKNKKLAKESMSIIENEFVSSSHTGSSISLFITILEMLKFGDQYARQTVKNSQALAAALAKEGLNVLSYPKIKPLTHQVLLVAHHQEEGIKLINAGISVNFFSLFGAQIIRLGTQQVTRLGMKEEEMNLIAQLIKKILKQNKINQAKKEIKNLRKKFQQVQYCFHEQLD